ncbi:MAG: hypothetical protein ACYTGB_20910 [Planctomycetota bacterium]
MSDTQVSGLQVVDTREAGWHVPVEDGGGWMAAFMNGDSDGWKLPAKIERHSETDEVFLLLEGQATLGLAGDGEEPGDLAAVSMKPLVLYNVLNRYWHTCAFGPGSRVLIVERAGTGKGNTAKLPLGEGDKVKLHSD